MRFCTNCDQQYSEDVLHHLEERHPHEYLDTVLKGLRKPSLVVEVATSQNSNMSASRAKVALKTGGQMANKIKQDDFVEVSKGLWVFNKNGYRATLRSCHPGQFEIIIREEHEFEPTNEEWGKVLRVCNEFFSDLNVANMYDLSSRTRANDDGGKISEANTSTTSSGDEVRRLVS